MQVKTLDPLLHCLPCLEGQRWAHPMAMALLRPPYLQAEISGTHTLVLLGKRAPLRCNPYNNTLSSVPSYLPRANELLSRL